jgi:hypothetical protein
MTFKDLLPMAAAVGFIALAAAPNASAALITETYDVNATNVTGNYIVSGEPATPPANPFLLSVTMTFDPDMDYLTASSASTIPFITVNSSNVAYDRPVVFTVNAGATISNVEIGTFSPTGVIGPGNWFDIIFELDAYPGHPGDIDPYAPEGFAVQYGCDDCGPDGTLSASFYSETGTITAIPSGVPEPSTWTMLLAALVSLAPAVKRRANGTSNWL